MAAASIPWVPLFLLGAAHGINPAMGWLFAVARGLQERDRRAVWRALGPLAAGHALAIGCAIAVAFAVGSVLPMSWLRWVVALSLLAVGVDGLVHHRHVRLGGMRVNGRQLATWSFLMASAHGAGLMVLPFVLGAATPAQGAMHHGHMAAVGAMVTPRAAGIAGLDSAAIVAPLVHTAGYLAVTVILAVVVYEKVGLRILRTAWVNVNALWCVTLIGAAVLVVLS
jgi:hypothetical protein